MGFGGIPRLPLQVLCDNAAVVATLTKGTDTLWRRHDLRRLHLSTVHGLRCNTYKIKQVTYVNNLADAPSHAVLRTARHINLQPGEETDETISIPTGWL